MRITEFRSISSIIRKIGIKNSLHGYPNCNSPTLAATLHADNPQKPLHAPNTEEPLHARAVSDADPAECRRPIIRQLGFVFHIWYFGL